MNVWIVVGVIGLVLSWGSLMFLGFLVVRDLIRCERAWRRQDTLGESSLGPAFTFDGNSWRRR